MSENTKEIGNEDNMAEIRRTMEAHRKAQAGGELKEGEYIDYVSEEGNEYKGTVVFKKPTMEDFMRMGGIKSEIFRRAGVKDLALVDEAIKFMAHVISTLEIVIFKRPEWLMKIGEIKESDVLYHVFGRYQEWEESFRKPVPTRASEDSAATTGEKAVDAT